YCAAVFFLSPAAAASVIYPLSLHDALPICERAWVLAPARRAASISWGRTRAGEGQREESSVSWKAIVHRSSLGARERSRRVEVRDRKSTRLNSSHLGISYAVFCLKKKKQMK